MCLSRRSEHTKEHSLRHVMCVCACVWERISRWSDPINISQLKAKGKETAARVLARLHALAAPSNGQSKEIYTRSCPRKTDLRPPQKICARDHHLTAPLHVSVSICTNLGLNLFKLTDEGHLKFEPSTISHLRMWASWQRTQNRTAPVHAV